MDTDSRKNFFEIAYRTGTDNWTHIPYELKAKNLLEYLPVGSLVLDLGAGRGRFPFELARVGYRVIGLDYAGEVVKKNNDEVRLTGLGHELRFACGDALDIPFTDTSFDAVIDFGLLHHLKQDEWDTYINEVARVLKTGGYYLSVELSRETTHYLNWTPKKSDTGDFEHEGVSYHFFTEKELNSLAASSFSLVGTRIEYVKERDNIAFLVSLFKKK